MDVDISVDLPNELDSFLVTARKMICTIAQEDIIPYRIGKDFVLMDVTLPQAEKIIVNKI